MAVQASPLRIALCVALIALLAVSFIGGAAVGRSSAADEQAATRLAATQPGAQTPPRVIAVPQVLSSEDRALYQRLFALEDSGRHGEADRLATTLTDNILVGDLLAARYLSPTYRTSYAELSQWLGRYGELPDAAKLYRLALSKKPSGATAPRKPTVVADAAPSKNRRSPLVASCDGKGRSAMLEAARKQFSKRADSRAYEFASKAAKGGGCAEAAWLAGLAAFRMGKDDLARGHFETLAELPRVPDALVSGAAYWLARVHMRSGRPQLVSHWLLVAAEHSRTFYGLVAQRALGTPVHLNWDPEPFTDADLAALANQPKVRRVVALIEAGQNDRAEAAVRHLFDTSSPPVQSALVPLIDALGVPGLQLSMSDKVAALDGRRHHAAAYPMPPWRPANGRAFDRALVFALARSESGFQSRARSPDGAHGVMQLMPKTARFAARRAGIKATSRKDLNRPEINIALGQSYIEYLADTPEVAGDLFRLIAAYNAGPAAVGRWPQSRSDDPLMFIESLPSGETRDLIERVVADYWIYKMRLGEETPSLDDVAANQWPRYERTRGPALAKNDG